jgi:hypothetical protein
MPTLAGSTYGALKAYIEAQGLGISVYKDAAPPSRIDKATGLITGIVKAYCTVVEGVSLTSDSREDGGVAQGGASYVIELVQLDLWMNWRDSDGNSLESRTQGATPSFADALYRTLDGCTLDLAPTRVYRVVVQNRVRLVERDNNIVHVAFTLSVRRAA